MQHVGRLPFTRCHSKSGVSNESFRPSCFCRLAVWLLLSRAEGILCDAAVWAWERGWRRESSVWDDGWTEAAQIKGRRCQFSMDPPQSATAESADLYLTGSSTWDCMSKHHHSPVEVLAARQNRSDKPRCLLFFFFFKRNRRSSHVPPLQQLRVTEYRTLKWLLGKSASCSNTSEPSTTVDIYIADAALAQPG